MGTIATSAPGSLAVRVALPGEEPEKNSGLEGGEDALQLDELPQGVLALIAQLQPLPATVLAPAPLALSVSQRIDITAVKDKLDDGLRPAGVAAAVIGPAPSTASSASTPGQVERATVLAAGKPDAHSQVAFLQALAAALVRQPAPDGAARSEPEGVAAPVADPLDSVAASQQPLLGNSQFELPSAPVLQASVAPGAMTTAMRAAAQVAAQSIHGMPAAGQPPAVAPPGKGQAQAVQVVQKPGTALGTQAKEAAVAKPASLEGAGAGSVATLGPLLQQPQPPAQGQAMPSALPVTDNAQPSPSGSSSLSASVEARQRRREGERGVADVLVETPQVQKGQAPAAGAAQLQNTPPGPFTTAGMASGEGALQPGNGDTARPGYLQVPFNKGEASGVITVSKAAADQPQMLLLSPSNAQTSSVLSDSLAQLQDPRWQLSDQHGQERGQGQQREAQDDDAHDDRSTLPRRRDQERGV